MLRYEVITDFNGIVIFEPDRLIRFWGGHIHEGTDLFTYFISDDDGDEVIKQGIVIPILNIDDAGYGVEFYLNEKSHRPKEQIVFENGFFPLRVDKRLVLADLAVLNHWIENVNWIWVDVPPGHYKVTIRGFVEKNLQGHIDDCGYEMVLQSTPALPKFTASWPDCRVLIMPEDDEEAR